MASGEAPDVDPSSQFAKDCEEYVNTLENPVSWAEWQKITKVFRAKEGSGFPVGAKWQKKWAIYWRAMMAETFGDEWHDLLKAVQESVVQPVQASPGAIVPYAPGVATQGTGVATSTTGPEASPGASPGTGGPHVAPTTLRALMPAGGAESVEDDTRSAGAETEAIIAFYRATASETSEDAKERIDQLGIALEDSGKNPTVHTVKEVYLVKYKKAYAEYVSGTID